MRLFLFFVISFFCVHSQATSMAEKLGYTNSDKLLIIHADDMGLSQATNNASEDVMNFGLVKSGSIMAPTNWASDVLNNNRNYDLGVHITLNSEWDNYKWAGLAQKSAFSLSDRNGFLHANALSTFFGAWTGQIEREMTAQVEHVVANANPTHIDTHMGTLMLKGRWFKRYLGLAKKHKLAPFITPWSKSVKKKFTWFTAFHVKRLERFARRNGWFVLDDVILRVDGTSYEDRFANYSDVIKNLEPGITQLIIHPSYHDPDFTFSSSVRHKKRDADARIFQSEEMRQFIKNENVKLIGWREIRDAYDWDNVRI